MKEKIIRTKEEKWTKEKTKHKINKKITTTLAILVTLSIPIIITAKQNNNINTINVSETIAKSPETKKENIITQNNQQNQTSTAKFIYEKNNKSTISEQEIQEYQNMPKEIKDEKVIGKLEIPSIKLETYIIGRTTKETLNISVTKLSGPEINQIGNFCITGHNYPNSKMFFKLHKVKTGEEIILTSPNEQSTRNRSTKSRNKTRKRSNLNNLYIWSPKKASSKSGRSIRLMRLMVIWDRVRINH